MNDTCHTNEWTVNTSARAGRHRVACSSPRSTQPKRRESRPDLHHVRSREMGLAGMKASVTATPMSPSPLTTCVTIRKPRLVHQHWVPTDVVRPYQRGVNGRKTTQEIFFTDDRVVVHWTDSRTHTSARSTAPYQPARLSAWARQYSSHVRLQDRQGLGSLGHPQLPATTCRYPVHQRPTPQTARLNLFIEQTTYHIDIWRQNWLLLIHTYMTNVRYIYGDLLLVLFGISLLPLMIDELYYVAFTWFIYFICIGYLLAGAYKLSALGNKNAQRVISGRHLVLRGTFGVATAFASLIIYTLSQLPQAYWTWDITIQMLISFISTPTQWFPLSSLILLG